MGSLCCIAELPAAGCSSHIFSITFRGEMPFANEIYLSNYPGSWSFRMHMVMGSISKSPEAVACYCRHLQEGDVVWKWNIIIQVPWVIEFQNIYGYGDLSAKSHKQLLAISCTFRREMPFRNEINLSKYPGCWSFRIHMVIGICLQNHRSSILLFPAPSGGRCSLKWKYNHPSTLGHGVSEHI